MDSASETRFIDPQTVRELITLWFTALDERKSEVLVGMCAPNVVVRPARARQVTAAHEYRGHTGIRDWVASLDRDARISLELVEIRSAGPQCAVVEAEVWQETAGTRRGGLTFSVWQFDDGKLRDATGYDTRESALNAAANL